MFGFWGVGKAQARRISGLLSRREATPQLRGNSRAAHSRLGAFRPDALCAGEHGAMGGGFALAQLVGGGCAGRREQTAVFALCCSSSFLFHVISICPTCFSLFFWSMRFTF
ncbi:MAG: hypothetical protein H6668_09735 [Ardenticatenaceae bacterium]|nr:hypothetical protein [Ardenticatenaceae bacterium]